MFVVNSDEDLFYVYWVFSLILFVFKMRPHNCACLRYAINRL